MPGKRRTNGVNAIADQHKGQESESLLDRYVKVRRQTEALCEPLAIEDYQVQPMDDASPPKWHIAHVTWFFETFILKQLQPGYREFHPQFEYLFNSYYNGVGQPYPRPRRGFLSRPTLDEVLAYRSHVDDAMTDLLGTADNTDVLTRTELGLNHEQQHQELLLTDLKYNLGNNPLKPEYVAANTIATNSTPLTFRAYEGGIREIGATGEEAFTFDNELPRHQVLTTDFELAERPVSNGEFIEFIEDGGYERHELWLSDGWAHLNSLHENRWQGPLYWRVKDGQYFNYSLSGGENPVDASAPVCHVSGYEADAFARWKGCRLPTEPEWEVAAAECAISGNFVESRQFHPCGTPADADGLQQIYGDVWEWTSSAYGPYPGFKPLAGQLGEYNGKFMANQLVLRGGSCATPHDHIRSTYRNFFYPPDRWQFSGIRLARDPQ